MPTDERSGGLPEGHPSLHSFLGIPIFFGGDLVGVAGVANRPGGYVEEIARQLEPLTAACAGIIHAACSRRESERDKAALVESEAKARFILNASPAAIVLLDRDGTIRDGNETHAARFGKTREELLETVVWELFPPEVAQRRQTQVEAVFDTGTMYQGEDERDGMWNSYAIHPVFGSNGEVVSVVVDALDITETKRLQLAEEESHRRYRLLFERANDAIFCVDRRDGRYLDANQSAERLTGRTLGELRGLTTRDVCPEGAEQRLKRLPVGETQSMGEVKYLHPTGRRAWRCLKWCRSTRRPSTALPAM